MLAQKGRSWSALSMNVASSLSALVSVENPLGVRPLRLCSSGLDLNGLQSH
ncbi:Hypothetical protein PMT_2641 [Prochlorococcus marinus str. MIT 9313]|uniref:Uncharacterized protein n=1 Tax=Prochlorococcus marinus (strain MIT 9313) TaxID=74547 RepID=B9ES25_PROMM|nr:Hypothetical protein PMT_2641 [Prochlorococcus marinus str. MIT 9313]